MFLDHKVDEAGPVFDSGASLSAGPDLTTTTPARPSPSSLPESAPTPQAPAVEQLAAGTFVDRSHPARATAVVLSEGSQNFVRSESRPTTGRTCSGTSAVARPQTARREPSTMTS